MKKKIFTIFDIPIYYVVKFESGISGYAVIYVQLDKDCIPDKGELIFIKEPMYTAMHNYFKITLNEYDTIEVSDHPDDINIIILYMDELTGQISSGDHKVINKKDLAAIIDVTEDQLDTIMNEL